MEIHTVYLEKICRVCDNLLAERRNRKYLVENMADKLSMLYDDFDMSEENKKVNSPHVCHLCYLHLKRAYEMKLNVVKNNKKNHKRTQKKYVLPSSLPKFLNTNVHIHLDSACICSENYVGADITAG